MIALTQSVPARPPVAWGYARVSTPKQYKSHLGLEAQEAMMKRYYEYVLLPQGIQWGSTGEWKNGLFADPHSVSTKVDLRNRAAGSKLDEYLQAGDHVVFPNLTRAWRNMRDQVFTIDAWFKRGIIIHFASENFSLSQNNPYGRLIANIFGSMAEFQRDTTRENTRLALEAKKERGELTGGAVKDILWTTSHKGTRRKANWHNRRVIAHAMYLHETEGLGREALYTRLNKEGLRQSNGKRFSDKHLRAEYFEHCRTLGIVAEKFPDALRK
jgi:DNA invertase Pin-like site-specific DNA recombinase